MDGNGHRRSSSPVSVHSTDRDDRTTRNSYEAPQLDHHAHPMDSPEPRHRSASLAARRLEDDRDREVERLAARYPDLQDWVEENGWNNPDFRLRHLDRIHRMAEIEREKPQLQMEFVREKARLKKSGEPDSEVMYLWCPTPSLGTPTRPTGDIEHPMSWKPGPPAVTTSLKRKRSEESDNKRDGGMSPKYFRTNHNHHEYRAGVDGSRGSRKRAGEGCGYWQGREHQRGANSPPPRGFLERSLSRSLPQRNPRAFYSFLSPAGYTLARKGVEAEHAIDTYVTPDGVVAAFFTFRLH